MQLCSELGRCTLVHLSSLLSAARLDGRGAKEAEDAAWSSAAARAESSAAAETAGGNSDQSGPCSKKHYIPYVRASPNKHGQQLEGSLVRQCQAIGGTIHVQSPDLPIAIVDVLAQQLLPPALRNRFEVWSAEAPAMSRTQPFQTRRHTYFMSSGGAKARMTTPASSGYL